MSTAGQCTTGGKCRWWLAFWGCQLVRRGR